MEQMAEATDDYVKIDPKRHILKKALPTVCWRQNISDGLKLFLLLRRLKEESKNPN